MRRPTMGGMTGGARALGLLVAIALGGLVWALLAVRGGPAVELAREASRAAARETPEPEPSVGALLAGPEGATVRTRTAEGGARARVRLPGPGRLIGTVRAREAAAGAPVAGALVRLLPMPPVGAAIGPEIGRFFGVGDELERRARPVAETVSGPNGSFAFEGIREGRWYLDVVSDAHYVDEPAVARVLASGSGGPVDLWVRAGARVTGRVVDPGGAPVAGADVAFGTGSMRFLEAAGDGEVALLRTRTDAGGRFAFTAVPFAEGYELAALGPGIAITHVIGIDVRAGEPVDVLVVGRPAVGLTGRILGRDAEGAELPLEGALVAALPRGLRNLKLAREILVRTHGVTAADGTYTLEGLAPGEADVLAIADGHLPARGPLVSVPSAGTVPVPDFVLERGPMVAGVVVDSATGQPVSGARVLWNILDFDEIEGQPSLAPVVVGGMAEFEFPVTGADGRFVAGPFPKDPPFAIRVRRDGYAIGRVEWDPERDGDDIVVELARGGAVEGEVVDAGTGEPVRAFDVAVQGRIEPGPDAPTTLNPFAIDVVFEHENGRFRLPAVEPGAQTIDVTAKGYLPASADLFVGPASAEPVRVRIELERGATIRGTVVDEEGAPVAGAQVTTDRSISASFERMEAQRGAIEDALAIRGEPRRRTPPVGFLRYAAALGLVERGLVTTDAEGAFVLFGLERGAHDVIVFHADHETATVGVELAAADAEVTVEIVLRAGATVHGTVSDRFGRPVPDATVVLASPGLMAGADSGDLRQARTRDDGSYEVTNLTGGPYVVVSTHGDEELAVSSLVGSLDFGFVFVPKGARIRYDIVDESSGGCAVTGTVTRGGRVVEDGLIVATAASGGGLLGIDFKVAPLENDGTFAFEGLEPGDYTFTYEERGQRRRGRVGEGRGGSVPVNVPDAPALVIAIELPEGGISGRVVAADDGAPVADVRVLVEPEGPSGADAGGERLLGVDLGDAARVRVARTDSDGRFVVRDLAAGSYVLEVDRARVRRGENDVVLVAPEPALVRVDDDRLTDVGDVPLSPGEDLEGRVVDEDGRAVEDASVVATWAGNSASGSTPRVTATSDADGAFALFGLREGRWRLRALGDGYADPEPVAVEVGASAAREPLELCLVRGVELVLEVTDAATGAPIAGATATLRRATDEAVAEAETGGLLRRFFTGDATTDADGRLTLGRVERTVRYVVRVEARGEVKSRDVTLAADARAEATVAVSFD